MHPSTRLDKSSCRPSALPPPWTDLLGRFVGGFTRPSFATFCKLVVAWIICPGRHTITRLYLLAEVEGDHAHDAYHRFLRDGVWNFDWLWRTVTVLLVQQLCPQGPVRLAIDDTIFRKWGRKVEGSGRYKDPLRSLGRSVVYMTGLNFVCLTLLVPTSWGTLTLALPVGVRLYRKRISTHLELALEMLQAVAEWLPDREFIVVADGAYSRLARNELKRITVISRSRKNAEIYDPEFPRLRRPGRPRRRGDRLPSPAEMAAARRLPWRVSRGLSGGGSLSGRSLPVACSGGPPAVSVRSSWSLFATPLASTATSTCSPPMRPRTLKRWSAPMPIAGRSR